MLRSQVAEERPNVVWLGDFAEDEKARIVSLFETDVPYSLYMGSRVVKDDLDGDGNSEYTLNVLSRDAIDRRENLLVLNAALSMSAAITFEPENTDPGLRHSRRIYLLDFDGDGLKDIVDQRSYHVGGDEEAQSYAVVLHNEGSRLSSVYAAYSYSAVIFEDLDGDGRLELIETTNEFALPISVGLWPSILRWDGTKFVESSSDFLPYYRSKVAEFTSVLHEWERRNERYRERRGEDSETHTAIINAMKAYLTRIESFLAKER